MTWTYGKRLVMPRPIVVSGRLDDWMGSLMCMGWLNMFLEYIGKFINFILRMINITKTEATWDQMIHRSTNTIRKRYQDPKGSMGFVFILLSNIQKMEYILLLNFEQLLGFTVNTLEGKSTVWLSKLYSAYLPIAVTLLKNNISISDVKGYNWRRKDTKMNYI